MLSLAPVNLDSLYRDHSGWLVAWLSSRAHSVSRASDLAQETFCRLAEQPGLRLHSHPRRYLATVARRLLIDDSRRENSERSFLCALRVHAGDSFQPGPDRIAEAVDQLSAMIELLGALPGNVQRAFLMSRVDGFTYAEISAELGVSSSMVKQYVARAFAHCYMIAHGCPD